MRNRFMQQHNRTSIARLRDYLFVQVWVFTTKSSTGYQRLFFFNIIGGGINGGVNKVGIAEYWYQYKECTAAMAQVAVYFNVTGGYVRELQASGIFNVIRKQVTDGQSIYNQGRRR